MTWWHKKKDPITGATQEETLRKIWSLVNETNLVAHSTNTMLREQIRIQTLQGCKKNSVEEILKPPLHIGDEIKFRDVDGKAYILRVMREEEE